MTNPATSFVARVVNHVAVSHLIGDWAGRFFCRKQVPETDGGDTGCGDDLQRSSWKLP